MTHREAKEILLLYRPGTSDAEDPEIMEATAVARQDSELAKWFEQHCAFQKAIRSKLRGIELPPHLKTSVTIEAKMLPPPIARRPLTWLSAAATAVFLLFIAGVWLRPQSANQFDNFQFRMVSTSLRDYRMDIRTNDMTQIRSYFGSQGSPADYEITAGLERLALTGGGALRWRNNPVSMLCFNRGDNQMLFLFVMQRAALKDPPPENPQVSKMHERICVRWSRGTKVYLLAGPEEADFVKKYL